jgi:hypothetical protein
MHTETSTLLFTLFNLIYTVDCHIRSGTAEISEFDKPLDTVIIDDVIWLSMLILFVITFTWLCCFWETTPIVPTATYCNRCCRDGPTATHCPRCCRDGLIHVRIEQRDCVDNKKDKASADLIDDHMPSAREIESISARDIGRIPFREQ